MESVPQATPYSSPYSINIPQSSPLPSNMMVLTPPSVCLGPTSSSLYYERSSCQPLNENLNPFQHHCINMYPYGQQHEVESRYSPQFSNNGTFIHSPCQQQQQLKEQQYIENCNHIQSLSKYSFHDENISIPDQSIKNQPHNLPKLQYKVSHKLPKQQHEVSESTNNKKEKQTKVSTRKLFDQSTQLELELEFRVSPYLTAWKRQYLAKKLTLTERQIRVWFQNRRMRIKSDERNKLKFKNNSMKNTISKIPITTTTNFVEQQFNYIPSCIPSQNLNLKDAYTTSIPGLTTSDTSHMTNNCFYNNSITHTIPSIYDVTYVPGL